MPRGRKPGFVMSEEHRTKIANSRILKCLISHVEGTQEMSATQVTAGIALLKKVMPDLTHADIEQTVGVTDDLADLLGIVASAGGNRIGVRPDDD